MFRDLIGGTIRREMRGRTDAILKAVKGLEKEFRNNTRLLSRLGGLATESIKTELRDNMQRVVDSERKLDQSLHEHIEFLDKLIHQL